MKNRKYWFTALLIAVFIWLSDGILDFLFFSYRSDFWTIALLGANIGVFIHRFLVTSVVAYMGTRFIVKQDEFEMRREELAQSNQRLINSEKELKQLNMQLRANEQQLQAAGQQLRASEQQLRATNQQLTASSQQLRASEQRYHTLFDNLPVGLAVYDVENDGKDFLFVDYNQAAQTMDQVPKERVLGRNVRQVFPGVVDFGLHAVFEEAWKSGTVCHHPVSIYRDNHLDSWRENFVFKLPTGELVAAYFDATPLKRSEIKLKRIFDNSGDALLVMKADGCILDVNRAAELLFDQERPQLVNSDLSERIVDASRDRFRGMVEALTEGSSAGIEVEIIQADGARVPVEFMSAIIDWEEGKAILLNGRSLAWRKRIENQIEQIQRMESIATLAGGIAHDFNNALAGILNCINLAGVYLQADAKEKVEDKLKTAETAVLDAGSLTKQLLTFAKGGDPVRRIERIEPLIKNAINLALSGSSVRTESVFDMNLWPVSIDHGQVMQVVQNILINARQAMADSGFIKVIVNNLTVTSNDNPIPAVLVPGPFVVIHVKDSGPGVPREFRDRLFEPFFSTKQTGSGLGLATAYSIVQAHEGAILLESELGQGAEFSIFLPASPGGMLSHNEKASIPRGMEQRVLVLDDEPIVRDVLCEILNHLGYRAEGAADAETAIRLFRQAQEEENAFAAVILDLIIPGSPGGEEVLEMLRKIDPSIRALVSSGYSNASVMANFRDHGFDEVIQKPSTSDAIARALDRALGKR